MKLEEDWFARWFKENPFAAARDLDEELRKLNEIKV